VPFFLEFFLEGGGGHRKGGGRERGRNAPCPEYIFLPSKERKIDRGGGGGKKKFNLPAPNPSSQINCAWVREGEKEKGEGEDQTALLTKKQGGKGRGKKSCGTSFLLRCPRKRGGKKKRKRRAPRRSPAKKEREGKKGEKRGKKGVFIHAY